MVKIRTQKNGKQQVSTGAAPVKGEAERALEEATTECVVFNDQGSLHHYTLLQNNSTYYICFTMESTKIIISLT